MALAVRREQEAAALLCFLSAIGNAPRVVWPDSCSLLVLALDCFVDFAAVDRDFPRRFDAESNLVSPYVDDRDDNIVADDDTLVALSGKDQHVSLYLSGSGLIGSAHVKNLGLGEA
jgi:hypothetical protein